MPIEAKPLFRPDVLRPRLDNFLMPPIDDGLRRILENWANSIGNGSIDRRGEEELLPVFFSDFFITLLGYTGPIDAGVPLASEVGQCGRYTFSRERYIPAEGEFADAVLGDFNGDNRFVAAVEGKGPRDPLDRPFAGRRMSAVDQGYRYAINLQCDWIIVTSMRQTRLYHKGSNQQTYERFDTEQLADSEQALRRFIYLLGANRVVPAGGECHFYDLLAESEQVGRELTRQFYVGYADMRQDAFEQLGRDNPAVPRPEVLASTQKLLDRVLFVAFAEDRHLLPAESIKRAYEHRDPYNPRPIWDNFRGLFGAINRGNAALAINAYNGGLFAEDAVLDSLAVSDDVCRYFKELGDYDYRPAHEASGAATSGGGQLIDVDILGHIFEQSITDLERLRNELEGLAEPLGPEKHKTRRKKEGAFYTPAFITRYIIEQALGGVLRDRFESLRRHHSGEAASSPTDPSWGKSPDLPVSSRSDELAPSPRMGERRGEGPLSSSSPSPSTGEGRGEVEEPATGLRPRPSAAVRAALADPRVYELDKLTKPQRAALIKFWESWQDELTSIRLLDPACGSGAFLIEAFDQLHTAYQRSNDRLQELRGHRSLFDLDKRILENNLYGVDLNEEAIEICRLSLWIKTAERGKALTSLDHTIRVGNSVVSDPAVHAKAFDWHSAFPEVFAKGGFDVVVGNPPYVRQESISPIKPYLQSAYSAYHGMADLYVYFYELGLRHLKPGGLLSFIVTNKWMKSGYGEPLRRLFADRAWIESVVDFGHAKQIFRDADVFPSIIVARKPTAAPKPTTARLCAIPREQLRIDDLSRQIAAEGVELPLEQLGASGWQLEPRGVTSLLAKIRNGGKPLSEFAGVQPLSGIKTGCNEAYLIDSATRELLVGADSKCASLIKRYLRGQDFARWDAEWAGLWMIAMKSSENEPWPWAERTHDAEDVFAREFPSIHRHLTAYRAALNDRQDQGRFWWELRSCAYWPAFDGPKVMYQEITWRSTWGLDTVATLCNNTAYILPSDDRWILAAVNSPVSWWYAWRTAVHGKDEALRFIKDFVQDFPIPEPSDDQRAAATSIVDALIEHAARQHVVRREILDWLRVQHEIEKPSLKLQSPIDLDSDAFIAEVKKVRGKRNPLSAASLKNLREEHARTIEPARALAAESLTLERRLSDLVNEAYHLTPEEIALLWQTAPPRMPITRSH